MAEERQQSEQQPVLLLSQHAEKDSRLRKHPEESRHGLYESQDRRPRNGMRRMRKERVDLRGHSRVVPGGNVEASRGVEDMRRVILPAAPIEGRREV